MSSRQSAAPLRRLKAYGELTKPRISLLLLLVALASYRLGAGEAADGWRLLWLAAGIWLLAAGLFALNQYMERGVDARMRRTRRRPLPSGRLAPVQALGFGLAMVLLSLLALGFRFGWLAVALALFTLVSYLFVYTPLKPRTPHHTTLGALSGAMPTLLGWAAATGGLSLDAWVLFAILFFWQFPHFLAIETMFQEDYRQAGIRVLPVVDPQGRRTGRLILAAQLLLSGVSAAPALTGLVHPLYLAAAALLDGAFLFFGIRLLRRRTREQARRLLLASVAYLPLLFGFLLAGAR
jgi:protoheme IX farnesyltransferase